MRKSLIIGDLHLGKGTSLGKSGIGTTLNSRIVDQVESLAWIRDQASSLNAETLIFTGDLFEDPKPDYVLVQIFIDFLKKCSDQMIEVHLILGNHDLRRMGSYQISILDMIDSLDLDGIFVHKSIYTLHKNLVSFTFLPFCDRKSLHCSTHNDAVNELQQRMPFELAEIPYNNYKIIVGHLALEGSIFVGDEIDDAANEIMCPSSLFNGYDYVWMGHVHKPQVLCKNPYIAHVGSVDISDFGETDHQKIMIFFDPLSVNKFTEIPIPNRQLRKISVSITDSKIDSTEAIINQLSLHDKKKSLANSILKLEIKLEDILCKKPDRSLIEKKINDLKVFHLARYIETKNVSVIPTIKKNDLIETSISPKVAVKLWAKKQKLSEDIISDFIKISSEIIDKVAAK